MAQELFVLQIVAPERTDDEGEEVDPLPGALHDVGAEHFVLLDLPIGGNLERVVAVDVWTGDVYDRVRIVAIIFSINKRNSSLDQVFIQSFVCFPFLLSPLNYFFLCLFI